MRASLLLGSLLVACSPSVTPPAVAPQPRPPIQHPPDAAPVASAPVAEWHVEVAYPDFQGAMRLRVDGTTPTLLVNARVHHAELTRGDHGWAARMVTGGTDAEDFTSDPNWTFEWDRGFIAVRQSILSSSPRRLMMGIARRFSTTLDGTGALHACIEYRTDTNPRVMTVGNERLAHVTHGPDGAWLVEQLEPRSGTRCEIVATDAGIQVAYVANGTVEVATKAGATWTKQVVSPNRAGALAATRGARGELVLAFATTTDIQVARVVDGTWTATSLVKDPDIKELRLAVDATNRAHIAYVRPHDDELVYLVEGGAAADVAHGVLPDHLQFALDPMGAPHFAFGRKYNFDHATLYARRRTPADPPVVEVPMADPIGLRASCAAELADDVGTPVRDPAAVAKFRNECGDLVVDPAVVAELERDCAKTDVTACLVAGTLALKSKAGLRTLEVLHQPCVPADPKRQCSATYEELERPGIGFRQGADDPRATTMFRRACTLGSKVGCLMSGMLAKQAGAGGFGTDFALACSPELPHACLAAVLAAEVTAETITLARATLASTCATSSRGCNALAFLDEAGIGGPLRVATDLHVRACVAGDGLSCTRLLSTRPVPVLPDWFELPENRIRASCSTFEPSCLALATAYESGWGVERDRSRAREILVNACDAGTLAACKRANLKRPTK